MTTIKLKTPIEHDGRTITEVQIGEPSVAAVAALEKVAMSGAGEIGQSIAMLAVVTGLPTEAVQMLKMSDFTKIAESMAPFVEALKVDGGHGGEASSQT